MAYSIIIHKDRVTAYLRDYKPLSREARIRLFANLHSDLRIHGDFFRKEEGRRVVPGSTCFWYDLLLKDDQGDGRMRRFSFVVNDRAAVHGVLLVEFVHIDEGT